MMIVNKIILIGQIGRTLELRTTKRGRSVCVFTLATHDSGRSREGGRREHTEWHHIVAWDRLGELCAAHLKMGDTIYVEGAIRYADPEESEESDRSPVEVQAITVQFIKHRELPEAPDLVTEDAPT